MLYFNDNMQSLSAMLLMIVKHNILSWIIQPILYIHVYCVCMYITVSVWTSFVSVVNGEQAVKVRSSLCNLYNDRT